MLLMALLNEHLMTFNNYKDAKSLFEALTTRFGGNDATEKTQKTLLKQMYKNFSAQKHREDLNMKFLRILHSEWNTHVVVWRNKSDLDKVSIDDLYNNFKIVEQEVKRNGGPSSSSSSHEDLKQIHKDDMKEMDLKWQLALLSMRAKRIVNVKDTSSKAMVEIDGAGFDWSYMDDEAPTNMAFMAFLHSK
nr:ribonuclease H-like domain-containing protein [Tanacetum cinerariifolium]